MPVKIIESSEQVGNLGKREIKTLLCTYKNIQYKKGNKNSTLYI